MTGFEMRFHGIMLEVLADSINEKAFDHIGDNILELNDSMIIYEEYIDNVKAMVIDALIIRYRCELQMF